MTKIKKYREVISLDKYNEDPYVALIDFIDKHGNPVYVYQGGEDDMLAVISNTALAKEEQDKIFEGF